MMVENIWEINESYFCPIVGYCLTPYEQKHIYKKHTDLFGKINAIEIHEFLVMEITKETPAAIRVQRFLNKKYSEQIRKYRNVNYKDWLKEAERLLNPVDFGCYIWISAAYLNFSHEQNLVIYGKVHIYSHRILTDLKKYCNRYNITRQEKMLQQEKYQDIRCKYNNLKKEIISLKKQLEIMECQKIETANEGIRIKNSNEKISKLQIKKLLLIQQIEEQKKINESLKKENQVLRKNEMIIGQHVDSLKTDFNTIVKSLRYQQKICENCEKVDLCEKKILIVGGLTKMIVFYRKLVKNLGGEFDYHDGRCHNSSDMLNNRIKQSDVVICPVDINSHAACLEVKKICKKSRKEFYMLRKSSISTIYTTLVTVANVN